MNRVGAGGRRTGTSSGHPADLGQSRNHAVDALSKRTDRKRLHPGRENRSTSPLAHSAIHRAAVPLSSVIVNPCVAAGSLANRLRSRGTLSSPGACRTRSLSALLARKNLVGRHLLRPPLASTPSWPTPTARPESTSPPGSGDQRSRRNAHIQKTPTEIRPDRDGQHAQSQIGGITRPRNRSSVFNCSNVVENTHTVAPPRWASAAHKDAVHTLPAQPIKT